MLGSIDWTGKLCKIGAEQDNLVSCTPSEWQTKGRQLWRCSCITMLRSSILFWDNEMVRTLLPFEKWLNINDYKGGQYSKGNAMQSFRCYFSLICWDTSQLSFDLKNVCICLFVVLLMHRMFFYTESSKKMKIGNCSENGRHILGRWLDEPSVYHHQSWATFNNSDQRTIGLGDIDVEGHSGCVSTPWHHCDISNAIWSEMKQIWDFHPKRAERQWDYVWCIVIACLIGCTC